MFQTGYWRKGKDLESLRKDLDRLWERVKSKAATGCACAPPAELIETRDSLIARFDLPGVDVSNVDVSLAGNKLVVRGDRRRESVPEEAEHLSEMEYGRFCRTIELPAEVDPSAVAAIYKNGMLTVTLPKTEEARGKEVKIPVG